MTKDKLDLDEEFNENLDFLEDDDPHMDPKGHVTLPYKPPFNFNNLPNQLLMIGAAVIIGIIIFGVIINSKKKHRAINIPSQQTSTTHNNMSIANAHTNQNHNQHISTNQPHPENLSAEQHAIHGTPTINQDPLINNQSVQNSQAPNPTMQTGQSPQAINQIAPISQDPQLAQIGQIKQPATTNHPPEQPTNNSLTWQELKKSMTDQTTQPINSTTPQTTAPNGQNQLAALNLPTATNNVEINVPIGGFERTATTSQIAQAQANNNYKAQAQAQEQHIQELKTIIANITQELTANVNQIKELQNNLRDISRSISNVNSSVSGVDSKILNLTNTVDSLSMDVKNVKKYIQEEDLDLTANLKPSEPDLFSNTPEYVVHAVIPGRAWLKSSSGQIITITEGDSLGDYGKIALIDAANNIVRTSSGVVFR